MANIGSNTLASDMTSLYKRLNTVRQNHSLSTLSRTFSANTPTFSEQMTILESDLNETAKSSKYLTTTTYDLTEIGIGDPTQYQSYTVANSTLSTFEDACIHNSDRSTDSDDSDKSNRSHDGKCSYYNAQ